MNNSDSQKKHALSWYVENSLCFNRNCRIERNFLGISFRFWIIFSNFAYKNVCIDLLTKNLQR